MTRTVLDEESNFLKELRDESNAPSFPQSYWDQVNDIISGIEERKKIEEAKNLIEQSSYKYWEILNP